MIGAGKGGTRERSSRVEHELFLESSCLDGERERVRERRGSQFRAPLMGFCEVFHLVWRELETAPSSCLSLSMAVSVASFLRCVCNSDDSVSPLLIPSALPVPPQAVQQRLKAHL